MKQSKRRNSVAQFALDIANHECRIVRDDGVYRHVRFSNPSCRFNQWFDLVTWPGSLCFAGDMGTYVFARLTDMFEFFRLDGRRTEPDLGYWAEKCQAKDRDGVEEFCPDLFKNNVARAFRQWTEDFNLEDRKQRDERQELWAEIKTDVLSWADDGEQAAIGAACNFIWKDRYPFQDFYEYDSRVYTHRFQWCCHAIPWGIGKYDGMTLS
jgi:hypothetical protein